MMTIVVARNHFENFLKAFNTMDDLVIHAREIDNTLTASGTADRAYFISKTMEGAAVSSNGSFTLGQIGTILSLVQGLPRTEENELTLVFDNDALTIMSGDGWFRIPTIAEAHSSAGVEQVGSGLNASREGGYADFGGTPFDYHYQFEARDFSALRSVGKAISQGALFSLIMSRDLTYAVVRDGIRVEHTIEPVIVNTNQEEETITWFGGWLLDALKAMPTNGVIHLHFGEDTPLLLRHEADNGNHQTFTIVAPRQDAEGSQ